MHLFHCPWLHQLPESAGPLRAREPRRFGYRRRSNGSSGPGAAGPPGDGDDGTACGRFGADGW